MNKHTLVKDEVGLSAVDATGAVVQLPIDNRQVGGRDKETAMGVARRLDGNVRDGDPAPEQIDDGTPWPSEREKERDASLIRMEVGKVKRIAFLPQLHPLWEERPAHYGLRVNLLALEYTNADPRTGNMRDPVTGKVRTPEWRVGHVGLSADEFLTISSLAEEGNSIYDYDLTMADSPWHPLQRVFLIKSRKAVWKLDDEIRAAVANAAVEHADRLPGLLSAPAPWAAGEFPKPLPWPEMVSKAHAFLYGEPLPKLSREEVGWTPPTKAQLLGVEPKPDAPGPLMAARVRAMVAAVDHADDHHHILLTMLDDSVLLIRDECEKPRRHKDGCVGVEAFGCWDKVPHDSFPTFYGSTPVGDFRCRCRRKTAADS